ncbi:MAG: hypothetical protein ACI9FB_001920 [Candidatus Azotimanducaceae bacterium]|jgi:hypothetical protein
MLFEKQPAVFHITHHKAGSQWIKEVLRQSTSGRLIRPQPLSKHLTSNPLVQGKIYPTVYMNKSEFDDLLQQQETAIDLRKFYLIRDLRDTLVSLYFSLKFSHKAVSENVKRQKSALEGLDVESGLIYLINNGLRSQARRQTSWQDSDIEMFRYEDLINDELSVFKKIFSLCEIKISHRNLEKIVTKNSFKQKTKGRNPGEEDVKKHERKGISGDWQNHFTPEVEDEFKRVFAGTLIETGYETDDSW